ncbi:hypothetical protein EI982_12960 [Haloplanus rallus]|jgi:DNA-binding transcriptional ArsR family regulator|uniref:DUF7344 domain-containing protein n=1 Tax=Haloplanus rallus TaxID=1816183 RepID=A0A6B9FAD9_9EURY|nr:MULTISPECIES: hypothetical protein [Haloplanus]QGX95637.1 hypothetical protein EI982_12960 [Haloplanus rallus]
MTTSNTCDSTVDDDPGENRHDEADTERLDAVFEVLADARRRRVIRVLSGGETEVTTVATLAEALAERDPAPVDRLVVSLGHVHLPKLDAAGVIDYLPDRSTVRYDGAPLAERLLKEC